MKKVSKSHSLTEHWFLKTQLVTSIFPARRSRKRVELAPEPKETKLKFGDNAEVICFNKENHNRCKVSKIEEINLSEPGQITWFNVYGLDYYHQFSQIIKKNHLDTFLNSLIQDDSHRTKVVKLKNCLFLTAKSTHYSQKESISLEQMMFIVGPDFIWSIQEKVGDHFEHIRERMDKNIGHVRTRGADYLLFLLMESIVDNYYTTYEDLSEKAANIFEHDWSKTDPHQLEQIEERKTHLFRIRRSLNNLREVINQLHGMDEIIKSASKKYYQELREQAAYLVDRIDNDLARLESATNLFFSLQSHKLNEVMKTLTILSVIFIPLTFIAGIYGMNFSNMPELQTKNGYFITLGVMFIIAVGSILYFRRRKWF